MRLSPTRITTYQDCPRKAQFIYEEHLTPEVPSLSLVLGGALHRGFQQITRAQLGLEAIDPDTALLDHVKASLNNEPDLLDFLTGEDPVKEVMEGEEVASLRKLLTKLKAWWDDSGMIPMETEKAPVIEWSFDIPLDGQDSLCGIIDVGAIDPEGQLHLIDLKSSKQKHSGDYTLDDQDVVYTEAMTHEFGTIHKVGKLRAIKRPVNARPNTEWVQLIETDPPSAEVIEDFKAGWSWTAQQFRAGNYPRQPRSPYNSPCLTCDFRRYCWTGDRTGLRERPRRGQ